MNTTSKQLLLFIVCMLASWAVYPQHQSRNKRETNGLNASGQPHGRWVYYFDRQNNVIQSSGRYRNGKPVGKWILYYPDGGQDVVTRYYGKRARERRYHSSGTIEKKGWSRLILDDPEAVRYYWDGRWRIYNEEGSQQSVVIYREGELVRVIRGE